MGSRNNRSGQYSSLHPHEFEKLKIEICLEIVNWKLEI